MAQQPGWIQLYEILERGENPDPILVRRCMSSLTGLGETMLHWYAIEGTPEVLEKLIKIGFDVNVKNKFGKSPLLECSIIDRWDNAAILIKNGARTDDIDEFGDDYLGQMQSLGKKIPEAVMKLL